MVVSGGWGICPVHRESATTYHLAVGGMFALAVLTVAVVSNMSAPYGRHSRSGWGRCVGSREGWIIFESPSLWFFSLVFVCGQYRLEVVPRTLLAFWITHYLHRVLIYPLSIQVQGKTLPWAVVGVAFVFNIYNSYIQASQLTQFGIYSVLWFRHPSFVLGAILFVLGLIVNVTADYTLLSLKKCSKAGSYSIPQGPLFHFISCPNYLGEIVEWGGWALLTSSWTGLAFFVYTLANLGPRAVANHKWYLEKFDDYPKKRRALIPFIL